MGEAFQISGLDPTTTGIYKPRRPQETILYRTIQQNLETFLATAREACPDDDPIPAYVERTFRKYLDCGVLARGFARAFCDSCGHDFLVAYSCKTRGLCPLCFVTVYLADVARESRCTRPRRVREVHCI